MRRLYSMGVISSFVILSAVPDAAGTVIFNVDDGTRAAEASFTVTGNQLEIVLTNTSTSASSSFGVSEALTGIFFDFPGTVAGLVSATAEDVIQEAQNSSGADMSGNDVNVLGEFASRSDSWLFAPTANYGISSAKYIGGNKAERQANMNGPNLNLSAKSSNYADVNVGSADFGIVPDAFTSTTDNHLNRRPLIKNSVTFLLDITGTLDESEIGYAYFLYGKNKTPDTLTAATGRYSYIPEPTALALLALGGLAVVASRRRRARSEL